jgi:aryl-alcohol dehydrogenase-like predicted oxidoreductase
MVTLKLGVRTVPSAIQPRMTRRDAVCATVAICANLGFQRSVWAQAPTLAPLLTKPIPGSGERLPVVGLGTDKFRTGARAAIQAEIRRMFDLGGTVIDTAAAYGDSEAVIGDALAALGIREHLFLATKLTAGGSSRGGAGGEASFNRSLDRLRTQRIDLLQVHNLDGVDELMPTLQKWKQAGKIRYIGITTSRVSQHAQMVEFMRKYPLDFVQVDYSLANRDAAANVLPMAIERKIGVLANIPFAFGALLSQLQSRPLPDWARDIEVTSWSQFLLKYVVSHPAVTCSIPGSTQVPHLEDNQRAAHGRLPDEAMRRQMERMWDAG